MMTGAATVRDDGVLCYDIGFSVELALLTLEPKKALQKLTEMANGAGGEVGERLLSIIRGTPNESIPRDERHTRALVLVTSIGKAVGRFLHDAEFDGDRNPYYQAFWEGMKTGLKPEEVIGSQCEKLFYECGWESVNIVVGSAFGDNRASDAELRGMLRNTATAFIEGVETCLA